MTVLGAVFETFVGAVLETGRGLAPDGGGRAQLVGHEALGQVPGILRQSAQPPLGGLRVPARLQEFLEDEALLTEGPPAPEAPAMDRDLDLVEMPEVARAGLPAPEATGDRGPNFAT